MIHDDFVVDQLILHRTLPRILNVTQEWYDTLVTKDPMTIYIILDAKDRRVYHGEVLVVEENKKPEYFLSMDGSQYHIYVNYRENYYDRLVKISSYDSPQKAINDLNRFNHIGTHAQWALQCYNITMSYLYREISLHDLLIGIISIFGYRNHPLLQALIEYSLSLGVNRQSHDICMTMVENMPHFKKRSHVFKLYSDLYDLVVEFNFFKESKYRDFSRHIDLSPFIKKIPRYFLSTNSMSNTPMEN